MPQHAQMKKIYGNELKTMKNRFNAFSYSTPSELFPVVGWAYPHTARSLDSLFPRSEIRISPPVVDSEQKHTRCTRVPLRMSQGGAW